MLSYWLVAKQFTALVICPRAFPPVPPAIHRQGVGIGTAVYPGLSGQHAEYTIGELQAFASGERNNDPNNIMGDIASKMSDNDMEAVANYVLGLY
ncbi:hypothetical protein HSBAA_64620 [Vreelandella sulfidaeris]|uniref:Cytochrome c domain-containing protein n=1 Tax=Vreelandella sulfidaeris TaxID=115553 RepID=A0A455UFT9_9GAMM|nr:hypothetical protein HSBAA_64620 [Halomonas sulfidaeris]